jgi:serine protease Do
LGILLQSVSAQGAEREKDPVHLSTAIIRVAKENIPAVVYIEVTESREVTNPFLSFENDPFSRRFFGTPRMPRKFKQEVKGLGSGLIIDPEGSILTNYHAAGGATKIQ